MRAFSPEGTAVGGHPALMLAARVDGQVLQRLCPHLVQFTGCCIWWGEQRAVNCRAESYSPLIC